MKKRLSFLIPSLAGGGAERVVSTLVNNLYEEYDITLVLMNDTIVYDIPNNIELLFLEKVNYSENSFIKIFKIPFLGWKYSKICQQQEIDISISFMYRPNFISVFAKLFWKKSKFFISERSTPSMTYKGNTLSSRIGIFLIRTLYKYADLIIPNSKGSKIDLMKNFHIDEKQICVIENPFDLEKIEKQSQEPLEYNCENKTIFIMVGRLEKVKEHSLVIKAFSQLKSENSELWIVGEGPLKEELELLVSNLELQEKIKFIGFTSNPFKFMRNASCLVLSSSREGFPNVLIEAMTCGVPIISTDCYNGPREILSPETDVTYKLKNQIELGKYGILTPIRNEECLLKAMKLIIENENLYSSYKKKSQNRALEFGLEKTLQKFKDII